jgi:hypothetical protein
MNRKTPVLLPPKNSSPAKITARRANVQETQRDALENK